MELPNFPIERTDKRTMKKYFQECIVPPLPEFSLNKLMKNSESFPITFPIASVRCVDIIWNLPLENSAHKRNVEKILLDQAKASHPIIHEDFLELAVDFLEHKKKYGSNVEKKLYGKLNLVSFVNRLLVKRPVVFFGPDDDYMLINGQKGQGGWRDIGTVKEEKPLILQQCLSYDEIKLSALICISSPSYFINQGSRTNNGIKAMRVDHEETGVVIGVVGCRFEKPFVMDFQDMIVDPDQNIRQLGYGYIASTDDFEDNGILHSNRADFYRLWAKFYSKAYYPTWKEVHTLTSVQAHSSQAFHSMENGCYFIEDVYRRRWRFTAEIILLEANLRGLEKNKKVFLHIVGFGLGVWECWSGQGKVFLDGFADAIKRLDLPYISDIFFSWFIQSCGGVSNNQRIGKNRIKLHFGIRNPHEILRGENENKLCVCTYARDGNSLPGNEFWVGMLSSSGDPSQACSSQIAEYQNPHINPMVRGANLRIASPTLNKVLTINEYLDWQLSREPTPVSNSANV